MDSRAIVLHRHADAWNPASVQVEAYLRFTGTTFHAETCSSNSNSPTGQVPALEQDRLVAGLDNQEAGPSTLPASPFSAGALSAFYAARTCIAFAQGRIRDMDERLSPQQHAELMAYSVLIQTRLEVATMVSAWCEPVGFAETCKVLGKVPFPLNYVLPWTQRREMKRAYGHLNAVEVYQEAVSAITALADRLRASGGRFFFGPQPSSLDAMLVGHLIHYRRSPAVAPVLKSKVASHGVLTDYVDHILKEYFGASTLPTASPGPAEPSEWLWSATWSDAAKGQKPAEVKEEPTATAQQLKRYGRYWLMGAGAAMVAYALGSGRYVKVEGLMQTLMADDEDDEEEEAL